MHLSDMLIHHAHTTPTRKLDTVLASKAWTPITLNMAQLFPELADYTKHKVKGLAIEVDNVKWCILPQHMTSACLVKITRETECFESTNVKVYADISCCVADEYREISKLYFMGSLNLCLRSRLVASSGKLLMLTFANRALSARDVLMGNFYEFNAQTLNVLLKQHRAYDFDWTLKLPSNRK